MDSAAGGDLAFSFENTFSRFHQDVSFSGAEGAGYDSGMGAATVSFTGTAVFSEDGAESRSS